MVRLPVIVAALGVMACGKLVFAITIEFDYSFDSQSFFDDQETRDVLEAAAAVYEDLFTDNLAAIEPSGGNRWQVAFPNPGTGGFAIRGGMTIPEDTILIFVGGRDIPNDDIGSVDIGQIGGDGTAEWGSIVQQRGQANALGTGATDYGPWGGAMAFDNLTEDRQPRRWNFDIDQPPAPNEHDLFSAALSEIGKVLGIGTADSFDNWVDLDNNQFIGPASVEAHGGPVDLNPREILNPTHFADEVTSRVLSTGQTQFALNTRVLPVGVRKSLTELDLALMRDIGWETDEVSNLFAGDANQDFSFDQRDIVRILQSGKYLSGTAATWGDGDWDGAPGGVPGEPPTGDGAFDQRDIIAALQAGIYLTGPYAARAQTDGDASYHGVVFQDSIENGFGPLRNHQLLLTGSGATALAGTSRPDDLSFNGPMHVIPEPTSVALLTLGLLWLIRSRPQIGAAPRVHTKRVVKTARGD